MPHIWINLTSCIWTRNVTHMNESWGTCLWGNSLLAALCRVTPPTSHRAIRRATRLKEPWHVDECVYYVLFACVYCIYTARPQKARASLDSSCSYIQMYAVRDCCICILCMVWSKKLVAIVSYGHIPTKTSATQLVFQYSVYNHE